MALFSIITGLIGLSIVIFIHELGHFFFARWAGVEVEELSLGWGPKLFAFKRGRTSYRLSALPIGGYCKMKGEDSYRKAIEQNLTEFPREPGDYFATSPFKRILISLGGPLFNLIFAFLVFVVIMAIGYSVQTSGSRILLASDFDKSAVSTPAKDAGLRSGDVIAAIDGKATDTFYQIQEAVSMSPEKTLIVTVNRDGSRIDYSLKPYLDKATTSGKIGVFPWIEPVIGAIDKNSPSFLCGFKPGDRILTLNGTPVSNSIEIMYYISGNHPKRLEIGYERNGSAHTAVLIPEYAENGSAELGISWQYTSHKIVSENVFAAFADGAKETWTTISGTFRGIASLFKGVDVLAALSGPARITWAVGQVTTNGFETGIQNGFSYLFSFLAVLSIGLFIMNLLPIPILDGGWIILFLLEILRKRPARVKTVFRYQVIGMISVAALFLLTTIGDIRFFSGK